jgi:hypothetical protein
MGHRPPGGKPEERSGSQRGSGERRGAVRTAVFCILLWMCFGSKPDEETVISVQGVMRESS